MSFTILDDDDTYEQPQWAFCRICGVDRDTSAFADAGVCPYCHTALEDQASRTEVEAALAELAAPPPPRQTPLKTDPFDVTESYTPPTPQINPDVARELASRALCRRKFMPFVKRFRPKYDAGWVHEDICRRLEKFIDDVEAGLSPRLLLMLPPRTGKQLADDTPVPTPSGWTTHGALRPGDEVFHPSGSPVRVKAVSEKTPSDVKMTFSDGSEFYCHENHEWVLYDRGRMEWRTLEAGYFLRPSHLGTAPKPQSGGRAIFQLPVVAPLQFSGTEFTMHPYVLGAWLGDGSASKPCITSAASDGAIMDKVASLGYPVTTVCTHPETGVPTTYFSGDNNHDVGLVAKKRGPIPGRMSQELEYLGVRDNKHIPDAYQRLTVELRMELLAGLVDTDGTTCESGKIVIVTVIDALADGIMELCTGLGLRPYRYTVPPTLSSSGIQGVRPCHVIGFQPTGPLPVVLARKQPRRFATQRRVGLVSVERITSSEKTGNCIEVDTPDGQYVVGRNLTVTHNSELGSRHFPAWALGKHPEWEIIAASHTSSLTMSFSRYVRDLLRDPAYTAIFPATKLDPSSQSIENWNIQTGGGYLAAGIGSGITGRGAHILILDDVVKDLEAANSQTISDNTWEWYVSTAYTRLAPGGGVLGILTWWHENDWAGRIQQTMAMDDGDQFEIVKYPAINDRGDEYRLPNGTIQQFSPSDDAPPEGSILTRLHNTAIHPARYTTEMMLRIKNNMFASGQQRTWHSLYQQNPIPDDGLFFTKDMFRYYSVLPPRERCHVYQAWDFAITENTASDYTVGVTLYQDENDAVYVADVLRFKSGDSFFIIDQILDYARQWDATLLGFEDGQIWKAMQSLYDKRSQERKQYQSYEILKPLTDKMVRASPLRGRMQQGKVYFDEKAPWFRELYQELTRFPAGKHDDICDGMSWCIRLMLSQTAPKPRDRHDKLVSWKDKLRTGGDTGTTFMAA